MSPIKRTSIISVALLSTVLLVAGCAKDPSESGGGSSGDTIKVGVLHSLSGTMAISEVTVRDSELGPA